MKRIVGAALCAAVFLGLGACASITVVPAGPLPLGGGRQVTLGRQWNDVSAILPQRSKKVRVLSLDGPLLNRLYLAQGLSPGDGMVTSLGKERPVPTYRADMTLSELVEFTRESVAALGYQRVETSGPRRARLGQTDGLRFELTAKTNSGLELKGTAQAAVVGGKLFLILFLAPSEHYYDAAIPEVDALLNSAA